ncbi:MAG TPA: cation diffusion facilitator family transporter [Diaminobutyricibacter sp.]|uniref:cation diffusion facilitator family transporter n=1 Tax=Leifsonia sp. McL0618 TaxID=3415677 RepID=UPI0033733D9D
MTEEAGRAKQQREVAALRTVIIAFGANFLVAVAKTIAAVITGSASMVAESAHSWADTGNEIFLLLAERRSARPQDSSHPGGYGRDAYVWSLIAAFGLFTAGAVVSITHGLAELSSTQPATNYAVAYIVLAVSFVFEGISFAQSYVQARRSADKFGTGTLEHVLITSNTTLRAVFAEDSAALIGLVIAFAGVLTHQLTGDAVYDAIGSILVGVLLAIVAIILIDRNRRFLIGEPASDAVTDSVLTVLLERPEIEKVTYLHLEFVGPERFTLIAAVDLAGDDPESDVAADLAAVEHDLEQSPYLARAVLTLSRPGAQALVPEHPDDALGSDRKVIG